MITVFGSLNADLVVAVPALPAVGETVKGPDYQVFPGGKGANQALAARRAGADVAMVGAIGSDEFGRIATSLLDEAKIELSGLRIMDAPTGLAFIAVDGAGQNQIVVASGANARVSAAQLTGRLAPGAVLVMQLELPLREVEAAIRHGRDVGARIVLNAAPFQPIDPACLSAIDMVIVNESEARGLAGALGVSGPLDALAEHLAKARSIKVIVTRGGDEVIAHDGDRQLRVVPPRLAVVDTTGAGDAFVGAFAAATDRGADFPRALAEGAAAGSLACMVTGAQPSLPEAAAIAHLADEIIVT